MAVTLLTQAPELQVKLVLPRAYLPTAWQWRSLQRCFSRRTSNVNCYYYT